MATRTRQQSTSSTVIDTDDVKQLQASRELLVEYLQEAHATETALVTTLNTHIAITPRGSYRTTLERHQTETKQHARAIERRVSELGGGSGLLDSALGAVQTLVGQALVLTKGPIDLFRGDGGEEKLLKNAKDEATSEMLEIATYDAIETLANAIGDEKTARLASRHREQEERALRELREHIGKLTLAMVKARAGGKPSYDWETTGAAEAVKEAADTAEATTKQAVRSTKRTAKSTARTAKGAAKATAGTAKGTAKQAQGAAKSTAKQTQGTAKSTAKSAQSGAKSTAKSARSGSKSTAKSAQSGARSTAKQAQGAASSTAGQARGSTQSTPSAKQPPIGDYDSLSAAEVVTKLPEFTQDELRQTVAYERADKNRDTVVDRAKALQESEPFSGYDDLTGREAAERLREATDATVTKVREYEGRHKRRVEVLEAAQRQISAKS